MKIVFMGTPDFAVASLEKLINSKHEVCAVVTKEDKPKGRKYELQMSDVKKVALKYNIDVLQPTTIKNNLEFHDKLKSYNADLFVVVAYGKIIPKGILDLPKKGCINVHGSLLPKYRGASPIQQAVINGDKITGVTTMMMDEGMDTGDILKMIEVEISENDTAGTMFDKLSKLGADLLLETLDDIENGKIIRIKQDDEEATYCKMIKKEDGEINWNRSYEEISSFIRGMTPWPSAYTYYNAKLLKVFEIEKFDGDYDASPGEIVNLIKNKGIVVKVKDGCIIITKLQKENKSKMLATDFLRGNKLDIGTILGCKE